MKKIMFSDKFSLTKAVLDGRKIQTRRIHKTPENAYGGLEIEGNNIISYDANGKEIVTTPKYKVGEVVAVAQRYNDLGFCDYEYKIHPYLKAGFNNKMFIRADLMPHQIRITNVRIERLKDISDEDCLKEGIQKMPIGCEYLYSFYDNDKGVWNNYKTPRKAFSNLINKVSRKDVWNDNPYVFVYDFEMVKDDAK